MGYLDGSADTNDTDGIDATVDAVGLSSDNPIEILFQNDQIAVLQTNAGTDLAQTQNVSKHKLEHKSIKSESDRQLFEATYGAFNLGLHVADDPTQVLINRAKLLRYLNKLGSVDCIHWLSQVHGNQVVEVDKLTLAMQPVEADALISTQAHHALAIMTADCVPICVWQQNTHKIAAIHAGWQGLANGIIAKTLQQFDAQQGVIHAMIGACISQESYEVSRQVVDKMAQALASDVQSFVQAHDDIQKAWLDLPAIAVKQLQQAGINSENINQDYHSSIAQNSVGKNAWACSYQDTRYYSYRRMTHQKEPQTGRMAMLIVRLK